MSSVIFIALGNAALKACLRHCSQQRALCTGPSLARALGAPCHAERLTERHAEEEQHAVERTRPDNFPPGSVGRVITYTLTI